jgi:AcrR family transcriptional regulator
MFKGKDEMTMKTDSEQGLSLTPPTPVADAEMAFFLDALYRWTEVSSRPAPSYQRGVNTRAQIVEAARSAFVRIGYIDCSVEDILREANISRGTFYSHFRSKKAAFAAVVESHIRGRLSQTNVTNLDRTDYRGKVRATIERFFENYTDTQDFSMVIEQVAHYDPDFREIRLVIRDIFIDRITRGIRRQQQHGTVAPELNARNAAMLIMSMMTNVAQVEIGWKKHKPGADIIEMMTDFWCTGIGLTQDEAH